MYELPVTYIALYFKLLWANDNKGIDIIVQFPDISKRTQQRYIKDLLAVVDPEGHAIFACNGDTIWLTKRHMIALSSLFQR